MYQSEEEILQIVNGFKDRTLVKSQWTHEAHLVTALWHHKMDSAHEAICYLRSGIILFNESTGRKNTPNDGYHETLTLFWCKVVGDFASSHPTLPLVQLCNAFLRSGQASKDLPLKFYSMEVLFSVEARATFVKPDLLPG